MSEYVDDVLSRISQVHPTEPAQQQREQDEAGRAARAAEKEAAERERLEGLGAQITGLLRRSEVPTLPIMVSREVGTVATTRIHRSGASYPQTMARSYRLEQDGEGWHVFTAPVFQGFDTDMSTIHLGINDKGDVLWFPSTGYAEGDKQVRAIVKPDLSQSAAEQLRILESDPFRNGLASLIRGYGPYHVPTPEV